MLPENVTRHMNKPGWRSLTASVKFEILQKGERGASIPAVFHVRPSGCTIPAWYELAVYIRDQQLYTEQVQDFTPTPMSVSTCMYFTGLDPFTMEAVHVPGSREEDPAGTDALPGSQKLPSCCRRADARGRRDLIGTGKECLVPAGASLLPREGNFPGKKRKAAKPGRSGLR